MHSSWTSLGNIYPWVTVVYSGDAYVVVKKEEKMDKICKCVPYVSIDLLVKYSLLRLEKGAHHLMWAERTAIATKII